MPTAKKRKKPKKTSRPSPAAKKKTPAKLVLARRKPSPQKASKKKRVRSKAAGADMVSFEPRDLGARSGRQAGDVQGLSSVEGAASESVGELLEEGNAYEAEVVKGVEDAKNRDEMEVETYEVPEDNVPEEYRDRD